jgi:hypothetical protein
MASSPCLATHADEKQAPAWGEAERTGASRFAGEIGPWHRRAEFVDAHAQQDALSDVAHFEAVVLTAGQRVVACHLRDGRQRRRTGRVVAPWRSFCLLAAWADWLAFRGILFGSKCLLRRQIRAGCLWRLRRRRFRIFGLAVGTAP